ncbi:hypothetical protein [Paraburkholderia acidisoli]|uniref:Uncharacterized protein n=1 Tax=Paraburkholderia acidisoli TaxID=2571748 RepID=A0A7Z2GR59_9BURK|nr:hypothetical protein [Paraburkholderia acidisoli]QGZ66448.1 hypothetical protein FAZ98_32215 [Paraburkholderia acidisoli]
MSAPDTPTPKAAPSLLGDAPAPAAGKTAAAPANGSRILANLEGRVVPPAAPPRATGRSGKAVALLALCLLAVGGFGAWHVYERGTGASATRSTQPAAADNPATKPAVVAAASVPAAAPQTATIVNDDDADTARPAAAASSAGDDNRLSRALSDGAKDDANVAAASSAPVTASTASSTAATSASHKEAEAKAASHHETKSDARAEAKKAHHAAAVAQAKKREAHRAGTKDDSDADLLAVLVARTKPSDGKADARPAKTVAASASLAQQIKACGQRGFFEEQLCRWRVCDGHWGKDAACPAAAKANTEH